MVYARDQQYATTPLGTFNFNVYDSNGNYTGTKVTETLPLSAQLKLWMEGGTVTYDTTYTQNSLIGIEKTTVDASGKPLKWGEISSYRFHGQKRYDNYGKSPYDNKQLIRVIPVQFTQFYNSLQNGNSSIIKYDSQNQQYSIKIDSNAFYDPNGKSVLVDIVYLGTWDGTTDMYPKQVGASKYREGQEYMKTLIDRGIPVVFGHDSNMLSKEENRKYFGIESYLGSSTDFYPAQQNVVIKDQDSQILQFPYKFYAGQIIKVPYSHQTSQVYLGETLAEFQRTPQAQITDGNLQFNAGVGNKNLVDQIEEQTKNKYNNQKASAYTFCGVYKNTALIQVGHTSGQSSNEMNKLITNILFYLKQNSKKSIFIDDGVKDKASPQKVTYRATQQKDGNVKVTLNAAKDNGTDYFYVQQFFKVGCGSQVDFITNQQDILAQSNVACQNVRSGTRRYYYIIDNNKNTTISQQSFSQATSIGQEIQGSKTITGSTYNKLYTFTVQVPYTTKQFQYNTGFGKETVTQKTVKDESELQSRQYTLDFRYNMSYPYTYVHVVAVDSAGNIGQIQTLEVKRPTRLVYNANQGKIQSTVVGTLPQTKYITNEATVQIENSANIQAQNYRFIGWSFNSNAKFGDSSILKPGQLVYVNQLVPDSRGICTLYAIWSDINTLTVDPNGGQWQDVYGVDKYISIQPDNTDEQPTNKTYTTKSQYKLGVKDTKQIKDPYKIGYNFFGWQIS